ncbi:putative pumilio homolog 7, chloroplastic [Camellia sinensis]|uniref:putative pumilio homolog 7, chloroplastic n=1 Tax=Camellia sinensis TaxID=4442 RepID=UPI001036889D|nr:putative pumilio homolog 7, chloroplastic [Camellia sinensis]
MVITSPFLFSHASRLTPLCLFSLTPHAALLSVTGASPQGLDEHTVRVSTTIALSRFIFDAAAKFCVDIATHQHGCCVLNRCIDKSVGKYQEKLVAAIAAYGLLLAQDAFG